MKKVLSTIGLLFLSRQFYFASAALSACDTAITNYLDGDNKTAATFSQCTHFCTNSDKIICVDDSANPQKHLELTGGK